MATTKVQGGAAVDGLKDTLRAFSRLDKDAQKAARDEVQKVANLLARELSAAGRRQGDPRNAHVAGSIKGTRERTPVVKVGSAQRMAVSRGGRGPRASDLMFGMEFGSTNVGSRGGDNATIRGGRPGWRFPERTPRAPGGRGNVGYWMMPTLRQQQPRAVTLWANALEKAAQKWGSL
jgi:hypothetical protein